MSERVHHKVIAPFDWINFFLVLIIAAVGLLFIFSATYSPEQPYSIFFKKQLMGTGIGIILYFFFALTPLDKLLRWGAFLYLIVLFFLVYTMIAGWIGMGAQRWVNFYFFRAQPSEAAKLFCPFFLGYYFDELQRYALHQEIYQRFFSYVVPLVLVFFSVLLIIKQPDLGTGLLLLMALFLALWVIGLPGKFFLCFFLILFIASPLLWHSLKNYQKSRILVLLGYGNLQHERYQVEQSKIAIGSGGIWGKGVLRGTQNQLDFLPEDHTDFIFSILCEEWGFLGALGLLCLYILLITRLLRRAAQLAHQHERFIFCALIGHIALSLCINSAMVMGIMPVVGIPLPLMSYGLSNLFVTLASFGWLNNYQQTVLLP